jgi:hypothetical protein
VIASKMSNEKNKSASNEKNKSTSKVVLSVMLRGKDVVEGRDGRTDRRVG